MRSIFVNRGKPIKLQAGQGMTEYIIILALIAVAAIGVYMYFGRTIRAQTGGIASEVSGQNAAGSIANAKAGANAAKGESTAPAKGMGNYSNKDNK